MTTAARPRRRQRDTGERVPLRQHLLELRNRLFIAAIAIALAAVAGYLLAPVVTDALRIPINQIADARNAKIIYTTVTAAFDLRVQISFTIAILISSPVWLYQIFAFLVPGLTGREKRYTFGFFFSAVPLFLLGAFSGWQVFPHMVLLLTSFTPADDGTFLDARAYYDFVVKLVLTVGIAFVLPVFLVLLNFLGVLSAATIIRSWRIAILCICLFTAIATPAADVLSMFLLAIPMVALYLLAALITGLHDKRAARIAERDLAESLGDLQTASPTAAGHERGAQ